MNRYRTLQRLAQARHHVGIGEMHLARQYEIICEFERDGHDATEAKKLLAQFIVMQSLHIDDCRRLERELESRWRSIRDRVTGAKDRRHLGTRGCA